MMPFNELLIYILFVVGFALTPGPNMMLFLTYTFEYGRKAGWATAAGIVSAFVVHITAAVIGLSTILFAMPHILDLLRYCGERLKRQIQQRVYSNFILKGWSVIFLIRALYFYILH